MKAAQLGVGERLQPAPENVRVPQLHRAGYLVAGGGEQIIPLESKGDH
jgi:hypothetical protein